ncbi:MAG: hypothetical protein M1827_001947 [Pycnora praestabilis]|nr:MAG: hypothetical protein M1827_001947 [Pycnora praestabilis]
MVSGVSFKVARPPTPPRESHGEILKTSNVRNSVFKDEGSVTAFVRHPEVDTPPSESPSSSADSDKPRKRVGFSPWTDFHKAPVFDSRFTSTDAPIKPLPPSRERRSSKSILKPFDRLIPLLPASNNPKYPGGPAAHNFGSFAEMLESLAQQLAGEERSARLDAYIALTGTLKAYEDVPDPTAMRTKISLFMQFIRRDISSTVPGSDAMDTTLITQALKLLMVFIWMPSLAENLTDEFCAFILDHTINILEDPRVPKVLINHHMHLLGQQKFSPKVMTMDRTNRLLTTLNDIYEHVKGNGILGERLVIYQRLLIQAKPVMITRVSDWIDHLFSGMLSNIKEIRSRAVILGIEAGLTLGTIGQVSRAVMEIFNRQVEEGHFANYLTDHLNKMMLVKEDAAYVPQIWSVVVLFLRSRRQQVGKWEHMKVWLLIIQRCFNSSDLVVKFQANVGWNRLVFAINLDHNTSQAMIKVLGKPIFTQMERRGLDRHSKQARQVAFGSYCNLLYYALRPSASFQQLDLYWDEYVVQILPNLAKSTMNDINHIHQVLAALLDGTRFKVWNENRANESGPIKPEDLPRLDPKWIRSRAPAILPLFEIVLSKSSWEDGQEGVISLRQLWRAYMKAVADAGSKEIKVSIELMEAIAQFFNMLQRIWLGGPSALGIRGVEGSDAFIERFSFLIQSALKALGAICFTEKLLLRTSEDIFEAAATPSHRSSRTNGIAKSPIIHILQLFMTPNARLETTELYYSTMKDLLHTCCTSRSSRRTQLEMLRQCIQILPFELTPTMGSSQAARIWQIIAELSIESLSVALPEIAADSPQQLGQDYRECIRILDSGLRQQSEEQFATWQIFFDKLVSCVESEVGASAVAIAVIEPLADLLQSDQNPPITGGLLKVASLVLGDAKYPRNRQSFKQAQKGLWGVTPTEQKFPSMDAFHFTYTMVNKLLGDVYRSSKTIDTKSITQFLSAVAAFVRKFPIPVSVIALSRIQDGVAVWVEDKDQSLKGPKSWGQDLYLAVLSLWTSIISAIQSLSAKDSASLRTLESVISAGLRSRRNAFLESTIELWNTSFGKERSLEYPSKVSDALRKLRSVAELLLPDFPDSSEDQAMNTQPNLELSYEDYESGLEEKQSAKLPNYPKSSSNQISLHYESFRGSPSLQLPALHSTSARKFRSATPEDLSRRTPIKQAPAARLRHDNSQIQFATIESSPLEEANDSQLLTDHQREVKERQEVEAAARFSSFCSSPRTKSRELKNNLPQLSLSSDLPPSGRLDVDAPITPTLPPSSHRLMDFFIQSSPTPRPQDRLQQEIVPSSSPPQSLEPVPATTIMLKTLDEPPSSPPPMDDLEVIKEELVNVPLHAAPELKNEVTTLIPPLVAPLEPNSDGQASDVDAVQAVVDNADVEVEFSADTPANEARSESPPPPLISEIDVSMNALSHDTPLYDVDGREDFVDVSQSPLHTVNGNEADILMTDQGRMVPESLSIDPQLITSSRVELEDGESSPVVDDLTRVEDSFYSRATEQETPSFEESQASSPVKEAGNFIHEDSHYSIEGTQTSSQGSTSKKRKRTSFGRGRPKRARLGTLNQKNSRRNVSGDEGVENTTGSQDDETIYDCIVVKPRDTDFPLPWPLADIKAEESPSSAKSIASPPFRVIVPSRKPSQAGGIALTARAELRSKKHTVSELSRDSDSEAVLTSPAMKGRSKPRLRGIALLTAVGSHMSMPLSCSKTSKKRRSMRLSQISDVTSASDASPERIPKVAGIASVTSVEEAERPDSGRSQSRESDHARDVSNRNEAVEGLPLRAQNGQFGARIEQSPASMSQSTAGNINQHAAIERYTRPGNTPNPDLAVPQGVEYSLKSSTEVRENRDDTEVDLVGDVVNSVAETKETTAMGRHRSEVAGVTYAPGDTDVINGADTAEDYPTGEEVPRGEAQPIEHGPLVAANEASRLASVVSSGADATNETENVLVDLSNITDTVGSQSNGSGIPTAQSIVAGLRRMLSDIQCTMLGPWDVREIDDVLFDIKTASYEASRRRND